MLFSEGKGRKIVSTTTADSIGTVKEFLVDPGSRSVVALQVKTSVDGNVIMWPDLTAFGADAVTVSGPEHVITPDSRIAALAEKDHTLVGKRVLSTDGFELGKVTDVAFEGTGSLTTLILDREDVPAARLVGVGSYAVVVQAE